MQCIWTSTEISRVLNSFCDREGVPNLPRVPNSFCDREGVPNLSDSTDSHLLMIVCFHYKLPLHCLLVSKIKMSSNLLDAQWD